MAQTQAQIQKRYRARLREQKIKMQEIIDGKRPVMTELTPLEYLVMLYNNESVDEYTRCKAAAAAAPYLHAKPAPIAPKLGVKQKQDIAASEASKGRFGPNKAPNVVKLRSGD